MISRDDYLYVPYYVIIHDMGNRILVIMGPILGFLLDFDISGGFKINHSDISIYYRSIIHLENSKLIYFYETGNITYVAKRCRNTTYVYPVNNT